MPRKNSHTRTETLLVELGTEELPPKSLTDLAESFADSLHKQLLSRGLIDGEVDPGYEYYATPRRLAARIFRVRAKQADQTVERRGPSLKAAFDDSGHPTPAAIGFAGSCETSVKNLATLKTPEGAWLVYRQAQRGKPLTKLITDALETAVKNLPVRKRMRWGEGDAEFVRPVHWLLVLHGEHGIRTQVLSVRAGVESRGHRFHADKFIRIPHADRYSQTLRTKGRVIASFAERKNLIRGQIEKLATKASGRSIPSEDLLEEVTGLVEWPYGVLGSFDKEYLEIPQECLISAMQDHQKYFHVTNRRGRLLPSFITISNIRSKSPARVRNGNERVLRARLSDARFFWETDLKTSLANKCPQLDSVLFHTELGSVLDKTRRLEQLGIIIADMIGADVKSAGRAAALCKADLVSGMVGEFPGLQGIMGRYYALHDGETEDVAAAIEQHYLPRYAGDTIPDSIVGQALSLADRIDTLVGIFNTGEEPTGERDPYALRRAALGILRTIIERKLDLDLGELLRSSAACYNDTNQIRISSESTDRLLDFMLERLKTWYSTSGFEADEIRAVLVCRPLNPLEFDHRLRAVTGFRSLPEAQDLTAANKRITNILRKADHKPSGEVHPELMTEEAEKALQRELVRLSEDTSRLFREKEFEAGLKLLAGLRDPVDRFFDEVMVMVEDKAAQKNRLTMLQQLREMFLQVADISELQNH